MTRIDFYLLPVAEPHGRLSFACRLAEKAFRGGQRVQLQAGSEDEAQRLDALLWSFRAGSFVPHALVEAGGTPPGEPAPAVTICWHEDLAMHHEVLVNLGDGVPARFSQFDRLAEIVLNEPASLAASRRRWSWYRDRGYALQHHEIQHLGSAHGD